MPKEKIKQGNSEVVADGWADGVYVGPPEAEQGPSDHGSLGGLADDDSPTYQSSEGDPVMAPYEPNPEPVGAEEDEELRTLICGVDQVCEGCEDCEDYNRELAIEDILLDLRDRFLFAVEFVLDITDDLFQNVFHRHEPGGPTVLIDDDSQL